MSYKGRSRERLFWFGVDDDDDQVAVRRSILMQPYNSDNKFCSLFCPCAAGIAVGEREKERESENIGLGRDFGRQRRHPTA